MKKLYLLLAISMYILVSAPAYAGNSGWFNKLQDAGDVKKTAPTNGQVLAWNSTTHLWTPTASGLVIDSTAITNGYELSVLFQQAGKVSESQYGKFDPAGGGTGGGVFMADGGAGYPGFQVNFETSQVAKIYWDNDLGITHFDSASQVAFNNMIFLGDLSLTSNYTQISGGSISLIGGSANVGPGAGAKFNVFLEGGDGGDLVEMGDANGNHMFSISGSPSGDFDFKFGDIGNAGGLCLFEIVDNSFQFSRGPIIFGTGGGIQGTTTNDAAASGNIGETLSSAVTIASGTSLTTATNANIRTLSLTAGDWLVSGNINFGATTATVTGTVGGMTTTSAALPADGSEVYSGVQVTLLSETDSVTLPPKRFSVSSTTTVYLVGKSTFSAGSVKAGGSITAIRIH